MLSFVYQELVGGAVFFVGLWLAWKSGELGGDARRGRRRAAALVAGLLLLALLQGSLQWFATRS
jgi:hypothetical protein